MTNKITMDNAGRVVIPKEVRRLLRLQPGDSLEIDSTTDEITLRPVREAITLVKEQGVWVYTTGNSLTDVSLSDLIDQAREDRILGILD